MYHTIFLRNHWAEQSISQGILNQEIYHTSIVAHIESLQQYRTYKYATIAIEHKKYYVLHHSVIETYSIITF